MIGIDDSFAKLKQSEGAHVGHSKAARVQSSEFRVQTRQDQVW